MATTAYSEDAVTSPPVCESTLIQPAPAKEKGSYGEILKSSAVIGGAQAINLGIGIARTKAMAMLLGPAGFGLAGLYNSIVDLTHSVAGLGVNSSGVRQIAEAVGSNDEDRIHLTIAVLRRTSLVLGVCGSLLLALFSRQVSQLTFGTKSHWFAICILSLAVFCKLVSGGQTALIQGMRRIADLAKIDILGAAFGAAIGIVLVYFFREKGIVPYLVAVAAMTIVTSWWYSRKVRVRAPRVQVSDLGAEAAALLKLGFAFMVSSMMTLGVAYGVRILVLHKIGLQATGLYQSAWTLGGMYVAFILQAMGADFYPRLTGKIQNHEIANRLVNEQTTVGLLLAGPGVVATLTFASVCVAVLYSSKFAGSVPILRWMCLGATLQVISWPMGFIIVAKGKQGLFLFSEIAWAVVSLILAWAGLRYFGVAGTGMAFFGSYVFHAFMSYAIARHLTGLRWSRESTSTVALFLSIIAVVFCAPYFLPGTIAAILGVVAFVVTGAYSVRALTTIVPFDELPRPVRRVFSRFGWSSELAGR